MRHQIWILWSVLVLSAVTCVCRLNAADPQHAAPSPKEPTATSPSSSAKQKKVDLNKASVEELQTLPGIGAATANAIVQGRPYRSVNELTNVTGIGSAKFAKIKPLVTVSRTSTSTSKPATTSATEPTAGKASAATPSEKGKGTSAQSATKPAKPHAAVGEKVNLNTATKEELDALPGIGPAKAQAIIDARPFKSIEDVKQVKGIKEGVFSKIKDRITVE
jgi:competence protein ComEA